MDHLGGNHKFGRAAWQAPLKRWKYASPRIFGGSAQRFAAQQTPSLSSDVTHAQAIDCFSSPTTVLVRLQQTFSPNGGGRTVAGRLNTRGAGRSRTVAQEPGADRRRAVAAYCLGALVIGKKSIGAEGTIRIRCISDLPILLAEGSKHPSGDGVSAHPRRSRRINAGVDSCAAHRKCRESISIFCSAAS